MDNNQKTFSRDSHRSGITEHAHSNCIGWVHTFCSHGKDFSVAESSRIWPKFADGYFYSLEKFCARIGPNVLWGYETLRFDLWRCFARYPVTAWCYLRMVCSAMVIFIYQCSHRIPGQTPVSWKKWLIYDTSRLDILITSRASLHF